MKNGRKYPIAASQWLAILFLTSCGTPLSLVINSHITEMESTGDHFVLICDNRKNVSMGFGRPGFDASWRLKNQTIELTTENRQKFVLAGVQNEYVKERGALGYRFKAERPLPYGRYRVRCAVIKGSDKRELSGSFVLNRGNFVNRDKDQVRQPF